MVGKEKAWSGARFRHPARQCIFMDYRKALTPMPPLKKGYVQLYTGAGKGKTTAALGLALRASGAGLRIFIAQFAKGIETSEVRALRKLSRHITLKQFGTRAFLKKKPSRIDGMLAAEGMAAVEKIIAGGRFDVVILDELCAVCYCNLVPVERVLDCIRSRPDHVEVIITGRSAPKELVEAADLVTEMREVKHYYSKGAQARKGIEY